MRIDQTPMSNSRAIRRVLLTNTHGLHLRPAVVLSEHARRFPCVIHASCGDRQADAKSILDLLTLAAVFGSALVFEAHGPSSSEAIDCMQKLVQGQFQPLDEKDVVSLQPPRIRLLRSAIIDYSRLPPAEQRCTK